MLLSSHLISALQETCLSWDPLLAVKDKNVETVPVTSVPAKQVALKWARQKRLWLKKWEIIQDKRSWTSQSDTSNIQQCGSCSPFLSYCKVHLLAHQQCVNWLDMVQNAANSVWEKSISPHCWDQEKPWVKVVSLPLPHVFAFCGLVWVFLFGWFVVFAVGGVVILFVAGGVVILLWCFVWFFGRLAWCVHFKWPVPFERASWCNWYYRIMKTLYINNFGIVISCGLLRLQFWSPGKWAA